MRVTYSRSYSYSVTKLKSNTFQCSSGVTMLPPLNKLPLCIPPPLGQSKCKETPTKMKTWESRANIFINHSCTGHSINHHDALYISSLGKIILNLQKIKFWLISSLIYGTYNSKYKKLPWLVWLSRLSAGLQSKGSLVRFPVRAPAWVMGQVPSKADMRGNHTFMFLFLSFSFPSPLNINK